MATDRDALLALFNGTDGASWHRNDNWGTDADLRLWFGVHINDQGRVAKLQLGNNNLRGPIPSELGHLSALKYLSLFNNQLSGPIPSELGRLSALKRLSLNDNELSGPIPPELGGLGKLERLWLENNELAREIPPELGNLAALRYLDLQNNLLSGPIPPELGKLTALMELQLWGNKLSGSIPQELGDLRELRELWLGNNRLTGEIPALLGQLRNLQKLYLFNNKLTGPIPPELGNLTALQRLDLEDNGLSGPIPSELGHLSALQDLDLQGNRLSGPIPPELGKLTALVELELWNNQLSAFWDHSSDVENGEQLQHGRAGGVSTPKKLVDLLALFAKLENNRGLYIGDNPWKEPPEAVVKEGVLAVSGYFADLFKESVSVRRNMIKVVLVGQEGAGKTSLRQSIRTRRPTPTSGSKESTVHIDVEEVKMDVDGVFLRVYDCAGQVAYTGLLQMFLSPRAVALLVCNTEAFGHRGDCPVDGDPLKQDMSKIKELRVDDWLRSLSFRIPDSDVVVVATKCDRAAGMAIEMAGRIENAIKKWLEVWSGSQMTAVRVEDGVSLTSCVASAPQEQGGVGWEERKTPGDSVWACDWRQDSGDQPLPSLLHRIIYNSKGDLRGAAMVLPRSWNIALTVVDALGSGRDPVESVHQMELEADGRPAGGEGILSKDNGMEGLTWVELSAKWSDVVQALDKEGVKVINPDHALEGAVLIREHEGSLVRHETYVFLDVTWLAKILKPLMNHRDDEDPFSGILSLGDTGITLDGDEDIASWNRFKQTGVLEPALASVLWPGGLCDYVLPTLDSLGLAHPLEGHSADGLVVLLRLDEERPEDVGQELDDFRRDREALFSVTWTIFMGVPPGAIEKVLMRCCRIGALRTFWRFGVLVQGGLGGVSAGKTFAMLVEYSHEKSEIDMKVYGNIGTAAPWAALSLGISAVRMMCSEFPGLRWKAFLKFPRHPEVRISKRAIRPGEKLLHENACKCCSSETGGVGTAATNLLQMIDVLQSRDEIFREVNGRFVDLQPHYPVLCPEEAQGLHSEQARKRFKACRGGMKEAAEGLLTAANELHGEGQGDEFTKVGEGEYVSGVSDEVAKLQRMVGELQRQLEQHHQDVDKRLETIIDADAGVMERQDFLVVMLMAMRSEGFDTPRQACLLPPWKFAKAHGLSEEEQAPEVWGKRLEEWREDDFKEGKGFLKKKARLFLVCAHTLRLVPCGVNGQGYELQQLRTWARMSVSITAFALQVMCSTLAAMAAAPLAAASGIVEDAVSEALGGLKSKLERLALDEDSTNADASHQTTNLEGSAYASLREFIHGVEDNARVEIIKARKKAHKERRPPPSLSEFVFFGQKMAQVQRRDGDAAVQWVLKDDAAAWYAAARSAPTS